MECVQAVIHETNGTAEHKYNTGELSIVNITKAAMDNKRFRIASLTPEISDDFIKAEFTSVRICNRNNRRNVAKELEICGSQWNSAGNINVNPLTPNDL
jgi:hypothetical protein